MAWGDIVLPSTVYTDIEPVPNRYMTDQNGNIVTDQNGNPVESNSYNSWLNVSNPLGVYAGIAFNYITTASHEKLVTASLEYIRTCYPIASWSDVSVPTDLWSDI